jgi:FkbM family methyltransferase
VRFFFRKPTYVIRRHGIVYEVDFTEGIDLSLFLFGGFQSHVLGKRVPALPKDATIIDVGANVGVMALQFAAQVPHGRVFAFEPTQYAFRKLQRNIALNPLLATRITVIQSFVTDTPGAHPTSVYSSWKVAGPSSTGTHPLHGGSLHSAEGAGAITIDQFVASQNISRLSLIKIDTDGYELDVLRGATETLQKLKPIIIAEVGLYILKEHGATVADFLRCLPGYVVSELRTGHIITADSAPRIIPAFSTVDCVAVPEKGR